MNLYTIPEDKLLDFPEDQLVALAAYNLMVLDIDSIKIKKSTPEHIDKQYQMLIERATT